MKDTSICDINIKVKLQEENFSPSSLFKMSYLFKIQIWAQMYILWRMYYESCNDFDFFFPESIKKTNIWTSQLYWTNFVDNQG